VLRRGKGSGVCREGQARCGMETLRQGMLRTRSAGPRRLKADEQREGYCEFRPPEPPLALVARAASLAVLLLSSEASRRVSRKSRASSLSRTATMRLRRESLSWSSLFLCAR